MGLMFTEFLLSCGDTSVEMIRGWAVGFIGRATP
jgi:hypothetical protein